MFGPEQVIKRFNARMAVWSKAVVLRSTIVMMQGFDSLFTRKMYILYLCVYFFAVSI